VSRLNSLPAICGPLRERRFLQGWIEYADARQKINGIFTPKLEWKQAPID
jgi:hypothetical protein